MERQGKDPLDIFFYTSIQDRFVNMMLNNLAGNRNRTFFHSMRTALIATLIGQKYNMICESRKMAPLDMDALVRGAFLHDIGVMLLTTELLEDVYQGNSLSDEEQKLYEQHPQAGCSALLEHGHDSRDQIVADILMQHHERCDGSGFPGHLMASEISPYAKIVGVADYIELALNRQNEKKSCSRLSEILRKLTTTEKGKFDPVIVGLLQEQIAGLIDYLK